MSIKNFIKETLKERNQKPERTLEGGCGKSLASYIVTKSLTMKKQVESNEKQEAAVLLM